MVGVNRSILRRTLTCNGRLQVLLYFECRYQAHCTISSYCTGTLVGYHHVLCLQNINCKKRWGKSWRRRWRTGTLTPPPSKKSFWLVTCVSPEFRSVPYLYLVMKLIFINLSFQVMHSCILDIRSLWSCLCPLQMMNKFNCLSIMCNWLLQLSNVVVHFWQFKMTYVMYNVFP
jgi:hypothetical protein